MSRKVSVSAARRGEIAAEKVRAKSAKTADSFQNLIAKLGIGTDNISSAGTYGFNPITRERTLLEWIHRGSWLAGLAIDIVPDDMTRNGCEVIGIAAEDARKVQEEAVALNVWSELRDTAAWGRLYGGAIGVHLVDGQNYETPLRVDSIGKGQYKGILALDRWQVTPSVEDLVSEPGPAMGRPKFYTVMDSAPGLRRQKIHYTRCIRMEGNRLPWQQRMVENLWGESILERVYDRLIAFDSTTAGAAQLVYKSYIRTYAIENLRELASSGGEALNGLASYISMMARFQSLEGVTLIDSKDKFEAHQHGAFGGLADVLIQFGQQISGAIQIPLVRLFGQSPVGMNSTGESDLKTYYENVTNQQNRELKPGVTTTFRCICHSLGIKTGDGFAIRFRPLWLLTEKDRAEIAVAVTQTIEAGVNMGVPQDVALRELQGSSSVTGVWSHITEETIDAADDEVQPPPAEQEQFGVQPGGQAFRGTKTAA